MTDSAAVATVRVLVRDLPARPRRGAVLRVGLRDDGPADGTGVVVATSTVEDWDGCAREVELRVPARATGHAGGGLTVFAHLGPEEAIREGDWITDTAYPIGSATGPVPIELAPVR